MSATFRAMALGTVVFTLLAAPAWALDLDDGTFRTAGNDAQKGAFTGEVRLKKKDASHVEVSGVHVFKKGGKQPFSATADFAGDTLKFSTSIKKLGFLASLDRFFGGKANQRVDVVMKLTAAGKLEGTWTSTGDAKLKRSDTWTLLRPEVERVAPASFPLGARGLVVDIFGKDLPSPSQVEKKDVAFFADGQDDALVAVAELVERTDDATRLRVRVNVDKAARLGARGVRVGEARKDGVATIVPGEPELALGGSLTLQSGGRAKLVVPLGGGVLKVTGAGKPQLFDARERPVAGDLAAGIAIKDAGTFSVRVAEGGGEVTSAYAITGETKPENKPYNFWYFPFAERTFASSTEPANLYSPGGAFEKLDKVFGLKPRGERFDPWRHMDKYAEGAAKFTMPTDPVELAKLDPSTTQGFAWSYQRSTDPKKSWWGHCWGSVIASSLHRAPKATTVATVGTESVSFTEEQMEGILSSYYSNHSVDGNFYVGRCPPGRPTDKTEEEVDAHAHGLWQGLVEGIKGQGLPLASNLRAESTADEDKDQVWNHVIWKFEAQLKRAPGQEDPSYVEIAIKVFATNDVFPSNEQQAPRTEEYVIRLRTKGGSVVPGAKDENWVSASHFAPSYLARITGSTSGDFGCENDVLGQKVGIDKLTKKLGFSRMTP